LDHVFAGKGEKVPACMHESSGMKAFWGAPFFWVEVKHGAVGLHDMLQLLYCAGQRPRLLSACCVLLPQERLPVHWAMRRRLPLLPLICEVLVQQ
jgi:hypothetical protein